MYDVSDCDVCGLIAPCEGGCPVVEVEPDDDGDRLRSRFYD